MPDAFSEIQPRDVYTVLQIQQTNNNNNSKQLYSILTICQALCSYFTHQKIAAPERSLTPDVRQGRRKIIPFCDSEG